MAEGQSLEKPEDAPSRGAFWRAEFAQEEKEFRRWRETGRDLVKRYRAEEEETRPEFNIFWSNVEVQKPTILSNIPRPDVARRFQMDTPVYRQAAVLLQKSLEAQNDLYNFGRELRRVRDDRLIVGRGVGRIEYEEIVPTDEGPEGDGGLPTADPAGDGRAPQRDPIPVSQFVRFRYWFWEDFLHGPARCWDEVPWIAYRWRMTREELENEFGSEIAATIALSPISEINAKDDNVPRSTLQKAEVFEVWRKDPGDPDRGEIIWLAQVRSTGPDGKGSVDLRQIRKQEPSVQFRGFFDCPEPLFATTTTDTMVPVPDATVYSKLLDELDELTYRIRQLIRFMQIKGLADGAIKELPQLMQASDGELVPATNAQSLRDKGGLERAITWWPIDQLAAGVQVLAQRQEQVIQLIYQVTGISDIIRGSTNPNETASAQQLKSNFAQLRMSPRQMPMQEFVARVFEMQAEVVAEKFQPEILEAMTGEEMSEETQEGMTNLQSVALMRQDTLRRFRIDVETDTLVQPDEAQKKQDAVEYISAVTPFIERALQAPPQALPLVFEMLKAGSRAFRFGRQFEDEIDALSDQMRQQAEQGAGEEQPDPEVQKAQLKAQTDQAIAQLKAQVDQQIAQARLQAEQAETEAKLQLERQKAEAEMQLEREQAAAEIALKREELQARLQIQRMQAERQQGIDNGG